MEEYPHYVSDETKELFEEAYNKLPDRLKKYSDAAQSDLLMNDLNLYEKALVSPAIHHGYINSLFTERRTLKQMQAKRDAAIEAYVAKYGKDDRQSFITRDKAEKSEVIKQQDRAIEDQREIIKYLEEVCKIMSSFNFSVKNAVDMQKMM
jgi:hypothetical protein